VVKVVRAAAVALMIVVLVALSGLVLGRIYADPLLAWLVAGAAVGSVAVSVAAGRLPSWAPAPLSVVVLAAYLTFGLQVAAARAGLAGGLAQIVGDALGNGIPRLLTAMIPVEPTPDTVAVPVVAAWLAGLAGAEVAIRAERVLLGCAAPAALYAGALYVVGPNAGRAGWPTVAFAAAVGVALAAGRRGMGGGAAARRAGGVRGAGAAAGGLAAVVALVVAVGPWLGGQVSATPVDPRQYVEPPQVDSLDESPLNRLSGWALDPQQELFTVSPGPMPAGTAAPQRIRLAVLPDYDGVTWRVGATYRNAGRVLPTDAVRPGSRVDPLRQEITVAGLSGRLLPAVPTPASVEGARVAYDPGTGTLIRPEGLSRGLRYAVTSHREVPDLNLLPAAAVPAGDPVARYLALGDRVPEQVRRLAEQLAQDNGAPYDRAAAIEQFLRDHYRLVSDAPSGHAFPNLEFFLFGPRNGGGQEGTSEQFAASFAVLGRLTGLPTRVVVGFRTQALGGAVTAGDAFAWPEVLFDELGWVAFDPLPRPQDQPRPVEEDFTPKPEPSSPPSEAPTASAAPASSAAAGVAAPPGRASSGPVVVVVSLSGLVLLVVGGLATMVVVMRAALRRRRVGAVEAADRVAGAWLELTDALRLAGRPAPGHLAASEVAAHARAVAEGTRGAGDAVSRDAADAGGALHADGALHPGDALHPGHAQQPGVRDGAGDPGVRVRPAGPGRVAVAVPGLTGWSTG
jgi:hypothetical protein